MITPALALPAHHLGGAPTAGSLLVLLGTGLGVLLVGALLRAGRSTGSLVGVLGLGQVGAHLGLGAVMGHGAGMSHGPGMSAMDGSAWPSPPMLVAHVVAVALAAVLVLGAGRVAPACTRLLRRLVTAGAGFTPRTPPRPPVAVATRAAGPRSRVVTTQVLRRGPPVRA